MNTPAKYGRTIAEQWAAYRAAAIPASATVGQVRQCRRAFYAGAQALQQIMLTGVSTEGEDMTEDDERLMLGIDAEFVQFAADVKAGRA